MESVQGKMVISTRYDDVRGYVIEGMTKLKSNDLWDFIDKNGKKGVPLMDRDADDFSEGLGRVRTKEGKWGYVNKSGALVIKTAFDSADRFEEGLARVEIDGKKGYIDKTGKFVWGPEKDRRIRYRCPGV